MQADHVDHFYGAQLFGRVAYHDFEGITLYKEERARLMFDATVRRMRARGRVPVRSA
jgi:hypothetical protein